MYSYKSLAFFTFLFFKFFENDNLKFLKFFDNSAFSRVMELGDIHIILIFFYNFSSIFVVLAWPQEDQLYFQ